MFKLEPGQNEQEVFDAVSAAKAELKEIYGTYTAPTTPEEYWEVVDKYWQEILDIMYRFGVVRSDEGLTKVSILKINKDKELVSYFNNAWAAAPDNGMIHAIPGFEILCDLCSESYLIL